MDQPEHAPSGRPDAALVAEVARLRRDQSSLLLLLTVVTGSLAVLLLRMTLLQHRTVVLQRPMVEAIESKEFPRIQKVAAEFERFGSTHPEFATNILRRYGLAGGAATNAPAR